MLGKKRIIGVAYQDVKTKRLMERIPAKSIAVLFHQDIDMVAADMLIQRKVKAIINFRTSMSGTFFHEGVEALIKANIAVFDLVNVPETIKLESQLLQIEKKALYQKENDSWKLIGPLKEYTKDTVDDLKRIAKAQLPTQFETFAKNSLYYGDKELSTFLAEVSKLKKLRHINNKNVLIVARGPNYEKDLAVLRSRIVKTKGKYTTIAVDGGADGLIAHGFSPDYILGDMDSVSEKALRSGAQLLIHTYQNGYAPGEKRVKSLGLPFKRLSLVGTSEDVAILFAFFSGAKKIYTLGTRLGMNEFLEKGRLGMGSSLLTRMLVGHSLVDLKGVHTMYEGSANKTTMYFSLLPIASALLFLMVHPRFDLLISIFSHWWMGR